MLMRLLNATLFLLLAVSSTSAAASRPALCQASCVALRRVFSHVSLRVSDDEHHFKDIMSLMNG